MTLYFSNPTFKFIIQKLKGQQVYLFNTNLINLLPLRILQKVPFLSKKLHGINQQPDIYIGAHRGLYYKINKEAYECTRFIIDALNIKDCRLIEIYNRRFQTKKVEPFVYKWISSHVLHLLNCLYRVHLHQAPDKAFYLDDTPINRRAVEWWTRQTGNDMRIHWLRKSETATGIAAIISVAAVFAYKILSRGFCFRVKPKVFKIMKEATSGLKNPVFRDDFFIDNKRLFKSDLLLYTTGSSNEETRQSAYNEARNSDYETVDISKLKVPLNIFFSRIIRDHLFLPVSMILGNLRKKQNYLLKTILPVFHMAAINYEILLSHYRIGLELSVQDTSLSHIPDTIILNNHGANNVIWHWSDMTGCDSISHKYKSHNISLIWGKIHYDFQNKGSYSIDKIIETGLIFNHNFHHLSGNKASIRQKLGLPVDGHRILAFYDESFDPSILYTEVTLLDFWRVMSDIIEAREDVIAVLKPKSWSGDGYENLSDKGRKIFNQIKARCMESGRFYLINNPREFGLTELIAISDINITMGVSSPGTIALLCGKIGLYYDTTENDQHPFTKWYRNTVVFNSKKELQLSVNRIIDEGYNPLDEMDPALLKDYDHFRDNLGLERFIEALTNNC